MRCGRAASRHPEEQFGAMKRPLIAMDTWFTTHLGTYTIEAQCEMLAELEFDGLLPSLQGPAVLEALPRLFAEARKNRLSVPGFYAIYDISAPADSVENRLVLELIERMEDCPVLELALHCKDKSFAASDAAGDDAAIRALDGLLNAADRHNKQIALYAHIWFWMERHRDAVRLIEKMMHPRLKCAFSALHWFAVDGADFPDLLSTMAPYLISVNTCGSRQLGIKEGLPVSIETLDEGAFDQFGLILALNTIGYSGPVALQGYSIGGDLHGKLRRSLAAFREIEKRADIHPNWGF